MRASGPHANLRHDAGSLLHPRPPFNGGRMGDRRYRVAVPRFRSSRLNVEVPTAGAQSLRPGSQHRHDRGLFDAFVTARGSKHVANHSHREV
jgi:hypothetical protein